MATLSNVHTEKVFEDELCAHLESSGWRVLTHLKNGKSYDRELALFAEDLLAYVQETQPADWAKFKKWHNGQSEQMFVKRVAKQLDTHGTLHLLRHGFKDVDAKFTLCQFKPAHDKNPKLVELYKKNRLTVIRQLHYSLNNENSIDLTFFVNGLPVATAELKTDLTQSVNDAIVQYKKDRLPKDAKTKEVEALLQFKTRALVHFAVSTDLVYMTTRLAGDETFFLPFNIGKPDGIDLLSCGAGNPPAPAGKGYPTYYLWEFVWQPDTWLEILGDFMHLESKEVEQGGKKVLKESLIFPRFHQLVAVKELVKYATAEGPGQTYLIQHSAGSGKSNSIAWTAHRLSNLHDAHDKKVFDTVIVVTDRRVLDSQLQATISQFEHKKGVVQAISENSTQLANALNGGTPIVVTTLQKFGFILEKVGSLGERRFALIIDEAHSSQSGAAARKLRQALTKGKPKAIEVIEGQQVEVEADVEIDPEDITAEDVINDVIQSRQRPENVSYFAFTATPKSKTLELFGRKGPEGLPVPFHVYSMRQAIEEGFILDVLKHYSSYAAFYQLSALANDKLVPQKKAKQALAQFAKLHAHNISQKVVVIVEHFREHVAKKIGGKAKAMLVTDSRKAAVRYKLAIDKYIKQQGYAGLRTLVAFSGAVVDPESGPGEFTESSMNSDVKGQEPSEAFKREEYRILLVASKYQVGFDQPLLHTMYVDKRLSGVLAVQTLSRLNRTAPGKEDTFVLDFVNKPEEILKSFQPYYRTAQLEEPTDPNVVHELMTKLNKVGVYYWTEVEQFAEAFFNPKVKSQASLHGVLKPAADRYAALEDDAQELFRKDLGSFMRLYEFLSQIIPYNDPELEKLFVFAKNLMPRLAEHGRREILALDTDVQLTHYRLQKMGERALDLESGEVVKLPGIKEAGTGAGGEDEKKELREIVKRMNDLFAGEITEADFLGAVTTWQGRLMADSGLAAQALNNSEEQFALGGFKDAFMDVIIDAQDAQNNIADQMLRDPRVFNIIQSMLAKMVWKGFQQPGANSAPRT
ncbi:type I restriction endonuclease subunit R [Aquabacterium sp.]|uniref:type I restriction endonuclease subunit R n=1 Tax=Aquabacterium sp. TaxID=1872578 RepID=UPI0035C70280